jgi:membrane protein DedA with SNARE-associated domain
MHATFEHLITAHGHWGYLILLIGTFLEGETILIIAGMAAARGILNVHLAVFVAFVGTLAGDQCVFLLSRFKGRWLLAKLGPRRAGIDRVLVLLEKNCFWLLLTFRFMYGLRNVTSIAVGLSRISLRLFMALNTLGALIWAISFGYGGFFFGKSLIRVIAEAEHWELTIIILLLVALFGMTGYRIVKNRRMVVDKKP